MKSVAATRDLERRIQCEGCACVDERSAWYSGTTGEG
jgi:hypothetical protein